MSLVDTFDDCLEPAYTPLFDPETARQQLRVSFVLVAAMALAAFILSFALPLDATHATRGKPVASDSSNFWGRLVTINER